MSAIIARQMNAKAEKRGGFVGAWRGVSREVWDGFDVRVLRNGMLEVAVAPELGAKVVSLKNLRTGRQWMYHSNGSIRLFRNNPGDDFARSPVAGWDECLPTITACQWRGRALPDHGEVWSSAWRLDEAAWECGVIKTTVRLPISPFEFTRSIALHGGRLEADYEIRNLDSGPQEYLWAMHPMLALEPGDRLLFSKEVRQCVGNEPWVDSLDFPEPAPAFAKAFAGPLRRGRAAVFNCVSGDRLTLRWDAAENDTLGIWLTRGGWNNLHHLALEPANSASDSLALAAGGGRCGGILPGGGRKKWNVQIQLEPCRG